MPFKHGEVHWNELNTRDVAAAKAYYTQVCGWTWDEMPMEDGTYHVAKAGDNMVAGSFDMTGMPGMENLPPHWLMYLAVDDVDVATKQTAEMGKVIREPFDVPGVGRVAIVEDASGAAFGIMTPSD